MNTRENRPTREQTPQRTDPRETSVLRCHNDEFVAPSNLFDFDVINHRKQIKLHLDFLVVDKLLFQIIVGRKDMLNYDIWETVEKPQHNIDLAIEKSMKPKDIDTEANQKPKSQKRKKKDSVHGEEPKRASQVSATTSTAESGLITDSQ